MIVADTSALAAVLLLEDDADLYRDTLLAAERIIVPAPAALELYSVVHRRLGAVALSDAELLLSALSAEIVAWTADHLPIAMDALRRFGGRPARLNFGDCIVYATARLLDAPLLYKGEDFARTDIRSAL